ncbi:MAG: dihydroorotase [Nitrospirae bacterium]|nr:dihydroorotase [Nitrospirota bacterium]
MLKQFFIKNGHIVDPSQGINSTGEIFIENGKIKSVKVSKSQSVKDSDTKKVIDAEGLYVFPGFVDMHTHLREPGFQHKETIRTGTLAAIKGGFTSVCPMPNTNPVNDNEAVTEFILRKNYSEGSCYIFPIGAVTKGQRGEELAEMWMMKKAGCVAFSDDGMPVMNSLIMRRALGYSKIFDVPIISHCEDINLSDKGVMNEGKLSTLLGLKGVPCASEDIMVARDIMLSELTGGRLHIAHVSTKGSVRLIRDAKERGIRVTAETCPHYFSITEAAVKDYNTNAKVNPPLRRDEDIEAIKEALKDGTIDVIATDHAPHHTDEKMLEFDRAPSGISGLETALGLSLRLVEEGILTIEGLIGKISLNPSKILGLEKGTLKAGADADITIVDMKKEHKVEAERFESMGKNTPFEGWVLKGRTVMTICKGNIFEIS